MNETRPGRACGGRGRRGRGDERGDVGGCRGTRGGGPGSGRRRKIRLRTTTAPTPRGEGQRRETETDGPGGKGEGGRAVPRRGRETNGKTDRRWRDEERNRGGRRGRSGNSRDSNTGQVVGESWEDDLRCGTPTRVWGVPPEQTHLPTYPPRTTRRRSARDPLHRAGRTEKGSIVVPETPKDFRHRPFSPSSTPPRPATRKIFEKKQVTGGRVQGHKKGPTFRRLPHGSVTVSRRGRVETGNVGRPRRRSRSPTHPVLPPSQDPRYVNRFLLKTWAGRVTPRLSP